jgi:hypothetical protein
VSESVERPREGMKPVPYSGAKKLEPWKKRLEDWGE